MSSATIYDAATGAILRVVSGERSIVEAQVRPGEALLQGALPLRGCRVNVDTGEAQYFRPEPPSDDLEWHAESASFVLSAAGQRRRDARSSIEALERQQARAIREHAIGRGGTPAQLKKRLEDIDDQITALREALNN